jgi:hypothetical protein
LLAPDSCPQAIAEIN